MKLGIGASVPFAAMCRENATDNFKVSPNQNEYNELTFESEQICSGSRKITEVATYQAEMWAWTSNWLPQKRGENLHSTWQINPINLG